MPLTTEQLELRKTGIGASEAAAAIGVCPHRSPMHVYADKIGMGVPFEMNEAVEWGNRLEPVIAQKYADDHGIELYNPEHTYRHKDYPWMLATPDRLVLDVALDSKLLYGVEIKSAGFRQYDRWGETADKLPPEYYIQVSWSMAVLDVNRWDMAVLIGGQDYREYTIKRDAKFEALMIAKAKDFWENHVLKRKPPEPDAMAATQRALSCVYPSSNGEWIRSDEEMDLIADRLKDAMTDETSAADRVAEWKNKARNYIGDAEGVIGDWGKISWKEDKRGRRTLRPRWEEK